LDSLSDEKLVISACSGDKAAQTTIVKRHYRGVFMRCLGLLGNTHDAEDIAQEVMLKAFAEMHKLREHSKFASWLTTMARNMCINYIRRQVHLKKVLQQNVPQTDTSTNEYAELHSAIEKLSDEQRIPLVMYYLENKDVKAIARQLDVSASAVYQKLRTATAQLHILLVKQGVNK
jgi:RNA polymerase sigma-70 factor (ECF subfamily)